VTAQYLPDVGVDAQAGATQQPSHQAAGAEDPIIDEEREEPGRLAVRGRLMSRPRPPLLTSTGRLQRSRNWYASRNLLGIDPGGVVHIAGRLLREIDGPMLRTGLQGFHGGSIAMPRRPEDRPDPDRLELRFERFVRASA